MPTAPELLTASKVAAALKVTDVRDGSSRFAPGTPAIDAASLARLARPAVPAGRAPRPGPP